jgi:divalent metal cation (Fe/Co/Zn/Cd) transporter
VSETYVHSHAHRHGNVTHDHRHVHVVGVDHDAPVAHDHEHGHSHDHSVHGHSHGLVDRSIVRSRDGVKVVAISLVVLALTTMIQTAIFASTGSVSLLADLVHNLGDALTAIPLGVAFYLRSLRGERWAGIFVVATIFVSACVAFIVSIDRLFHPQTLTNLLPVALAGIAGFAGNEIASQVRLRGGRRLRSPALIADGNHARVDGIVSLSVVVSAILVALGLQIADPMIGLAITGVILKITWDSWNVVSHTHPGEAVEPHDNH